MSRTNEAAFETVIELHLLASGYVPVNRDGFDRERAIFPETILAFIRDTQLQEWAKLEALHRDKTGEQILGDLCKWMDANGALATLRHGFKCYGRTLHAAFFKAAHELNPELEARYAANRVGLTRQLHFSPRSEHSLDVTLSLNGIPVVTLELKNPLTNQTVEDARRQYKQDRDPREPIFEFKRRTLVHFAVDTESVLMTTRLAGTATHFLPFNKGCDGGAGNPPDPAGRSYRTRYLWEEVLQRDSLLDLLARFIHLQIEEKRDDQGRKVKTESMIFPRYHQLQAVRLLVEAARREGVGHNYLVGHSAGSGKSNTIGWLTHRLASLHDAANQRVFDSVIVVTDRVVLDQQLQDTIYQFEHKRGVVQRIDESSRQLAEALENAVPVIITTLQKFPFVSEQLRKLAEKRGEVGTGSLATRRCAVIIDEAHSSQGGETATELKEVLGGDKLREEARKRAAEEGRDDMEELFRSMAKRGRQDNLSFFAFTATPKHKTLAVFGRGGQPTHRYTMRQAIEEEFILDVLKHYTTYATYFKLLKACENDPNVERKKAAQALARFMRLHPHNIAQKTEVMVEHFQAVTRHKIGGRAKAMVVTGSRLEAGSGGGDLLALWSAEPGLSLRSRGWRAQGTAPSLDAAANCAASPLLCGSSRSNRHWEEDSEACCGDDRARNLSRPRAERHAGCGSRRAVPGRRAGSESGCQAECGSVSVGLYVQTDSRGSGISKITNCDLRKWPRPIPQIPSSRLHRTRRRHGCRACSAALAPSA